MGDGRGVLQVRGELREGMAQAKCHKCGCMKDALESLAASLPSLQEEHAPSLAADVVGWLKEMEPIKYSCLGCDYCYPAVATNILGQAFPETAQGLSLSCGFEVRQQAWPAVPGEYVVLGGGVDRPVAVSTLGSAELAAKIAQLGPAGLSIVGKTETENIGIDKVVKNIITNPAIQFLLLVGEEPKGHRSGATLNALGHNGVDERMRVIGSPGKRPILQNVTREEVEAFRRQVRVVSTIGCEDVGEVVESIGELAREAQPSAACACHCTEEAKPLTISTIPVLQAEEPTEVEMDKAGYFVVIPQPEKGIITVEHYAYDDTLLRAIEGWDARSIYWTVVKNGWVSQLSHAAYLGKELAKAELSLRHGFKYIQDGA